MSSKITILRIFYLKTSLHRSIHAEFTKYAKFHKYLMQTRVNTVHQFVNLQFFTFFCISLQKLRSLGSWVV